MTTMTPPTGHATSPAAPSDAWMQHGLCRQVDAQIFFPEGRGGSIVVQTRQAKQVCNRCPVRLLCLDWAVETRQHFGVWGGLSEEERGDLWRRPRRKAGELSALEEILQNRLAEFEDLREQGLELVEIAAWLGTNVQTLNRVTRVLQERAAEVQAA
jgi:WhiB family redox-sensing transcriptional regulator